MNRKDAEINENLGGGKETNKRSQKRLNCLYHDMGGESIASIKIYNQLNIRYEQAQKSGTGICSALRFYCLLLLHV
jgi:hypothetical protein